MEDILQRILLEMTVCLITENMLRMKIKGLECIRYEKQGDIRFYHKNPLFKVFSNSYDYVFLNRIIVICQRVKSELFTN